MVRSQTGGTPGMHPRLRRLKQPKPVWPQFVHDRNTRYEQHHKLQYTGQEALWLVLVYEDEHDCADRADERMNKSQRKNQSHQKACARHAGAKIKGHSPWRRVREAQRGAFDAILKLAILCRHSLNNLIRAWFFVGK